MAEAREGQSCMASHETVSAPARAGRAAAAPLWAWVPLLAAALLATALLLTACSGGTPAPARSEALRGQALGPVVDSIVFPPFERGPGVQINALDLNQFREQLEAQVLTRPGVKAYASPPTTLANTVTLSGKLLGYDVQEQTAEGMFLRTIAMSVAVDVRIGGDKDPALVLLRDYSYQKLYLSTEGVAALEFDLRNAAREVTGALAHVLVPGKSESPELRSAYDIDSGEYYSHPLLVRGNREAGFGRYTPAVASWTQLIYDPVQPETSDRFRVSERTLAHLQREGVAQKELDALQPLTHQGGRSLETLRDEVRRALGPNSALEPKVLQLSDQAQDRIQINLSRGHYNLGEIFRLSRRYDVAAYHLAHAYAFDPQAFYLDAWTRLQLERQLIPGSARDNPADALTWLTAYLRVPAPFTALVSGGVYDLTVMPPPAFQALEPPARPAPAAPLLTPVALPPPVAVPPTPGTPARQASPGSPGARPRTWGQPTQPRPPSRPAQRLGY